MAALVNGRNPFGVALVVAALAGACGKSEPARTPADGRASCASDSDCVIATSTGCCGCCPDSPHAVPKEAEEQQERICAVLDCAPCNPGISCPAGSAEPASAFVAACRQGTCAAVHK